jgi:hypothetical protein
MRRYRALWLGACTALVVTGVGMASVRSPVALAGMFAAFAATGVIWTLTVGRGRTTQHPRVGVRHLCLRALIWAGWAGAAVGFVVILGAAAFLVGLVVLASSPRAIRACGRWLSSLPAPSAAQVSTWSNAMAYASPEYVGFQPHPELRDLTDEQLCREWRDSYLALQGRWVSNRQWMRTVQRRQRCLDEFERRNPGGLTAWLASGAWASSSPLPYLVESRSDDAGINWDALMREQGW